MEGSLKFRWKLKDFSKLQGRFIYSDVFSVGRYKWRIQAYPKGRNANGYLSLYLEVVDSETLPSGWSRNAKFSLTVINQIDGKSSTVVNKDIFDAKRKILGWAKAIYKKPSRTYGAVHKFDSGSTSWGWPSFIPLKDLRDPKKGFLVKDLCIIEVEVTMCEDAVKETSKKEPTEEDMDAFFGDLNSVFFPQKVVSSEEEAKQALAMIEEALNMAPADVKNPCRMSQLTNAFDVLSSLDDCSMLTSEQKAELLSMKDKFIGLPERAANVVKDIKLFTESDFVKKTLDQKLGKCLVEFQKAKTQTVQNEQNLDTLLVQIEETKAKKQNLLLKQKETFKLSKELKQELDVLVKNLPEYEAKMKVAVEEEKVVDAEWREMKQFVLSLNPQSTLTYQ